MAAVKTEIKQQNEEDQENENEVDDEGVAESTEVAKKKKKKKKKKKPGENIRTCKCVNNFDNCVIFCRRRKQG